MLDRIIQGLENLMPGDYAFVGLLAVFFVLLLISRKR